MNLSETSDQKIIEVGIGIVLREASLGTSLDGGGGVSTIEFLITRRKENTVFGGYWELPGGKAEDAERIEDCIVREIREEVGLDIRVIHTLETIVHTYPHGTVRLHPRVCEMTGEVREPRALEVAEARWCTLDGVGAYEFLPANEQIWSRLRAYFEGAISPR